VKVLLPLSANARDYTQTLAAESARKQKNDPNGQVSAMTLFVLDYTLLINRLIREAERCGAISLQEAEFLLAAAQNSAPAESTRALVSGDCSPDFPYAALYFSTLVWQQAEAAETEFEARAAYELAQFVLWQQYPKHDTYWSTKLLRELFNAHAEAAEKALEASAQQQASGLAEAG
jgi:hypothetical protein